MLFLFDMQQETQVVFFWPNLDRHEFNYESHNAIMFRWKLKITEQSTLFKYIFKYIALINKHV